MIKSFIAQLFKAKMKENLSFLIGSHMQLKIRMF